MSDSRHFLLDKLESRLKPEEEKPSLRNGKPKSRRKPDAGGEVVLTVHARERFAERGGQLVGEGEDPEELLRELAEDARAMCRRAGTTDVIYGGLGWVFKTDRGQWTLVTVTPSPEAD